MSLRAVLICGPRGAGKETIVSALTRHFSGIHRIVPHTTRPPRPTETNGKEYHFVSSEQFDELVIADRFVWWDHVGPTQRSGTVRDEFVISQDGSVVDVLPNGARAMRQKVVGMGGKALLLAVFAAEEERRERIRLRQPGINESEVDRLMRDDPVSTCTTDYSDFDVITSNYGRDPNPVCLRAIEHVTNFLR